MDLAMRDDIRLWNLPEPVPQNAKWDWMMEMCGSAWVAPWDDDDIMLPWRLRVAVEGSQGLRVPYIMGRAWTLRNGELDVFHSTLWGTGLYPAARAMAGGGAGHSQGVNDLAVIDAIGRENWFKPERVHVRDIPMIYRWEEIDVWHDSGSGYNGTTPEGKLAEFRRKTLRGRSFRPGRQWVTAGWKMDYAREARAAAGRFEARGEGWC